MTATPRSGRIFLFSLLWCIGCSGNKDEAVSQEHKNVESLKTAPATIDPAILTGRHFGEAPMLAAKVAAGELPPIAERLPDNPLVITPVNRIGKYGGEIHRALLGETVSRAIIQRTLNENLVDYERPVAKSIQLNLAESYEMQDNGKVAVFKIRKGVKWSDGMPFTVDDIMFWYTDVAFNPKARDTPLPPSDWVQEGEPILVEKIDNYTVKFSARKPMGRLLNILCKDQGMYPKHFWKPYHPTYNPEATYEDFQKRTTDNMMAFDPGIPRLGPWYVTERVHAQKITYGRNPYYWKIDTAGNQLPYADSLSFIITYDPEVVVLKFVNGELDLFGRYSTTKMVPTLRAEAARGRFVLHTDGPTGGPAFYLNWVAPDAPLRQAFRDKRVRMALSHALNREEISEIVYQGLLEPSGFALIPGSPYFSAEAYAKYSEYNPDKARTLLEEAGYHDSDGDGFRELKDGSRFQMTIDVSVDSAFDDLCELVLDYWKRIGIKVFLNVSTEETIFNRRINGTFDIYVNFLHGAVDPLARPDWWVSIEPDEPFWYRSAVKEGPEWLTEATELMKEAKTTVDPEKLHSKMARVRDLFAENVPVISVGSIYKVWGSNIRLGNVPESASMDDLYYGWSRPIFHEQIYIK